MMNFNDWHMISFSTGVCPHERWEKQAWNAAILEYKSDVLAAIAAEEELPGDMPETMKANFILAVKVGDFNFIERMLQMTVKLTKEGIAERVKKLEAEGYTGSCVRNNG